MDSYRNTTHSRPKKTIEEIQAILEPKETVDYLPITKLYKLYVSNIKKKDGVNTTIETYLKSISNGECDRSFIKSNNEKAFLDKMKEIFQKNLNEGIKYYNKPIPLKKISFTDFLEKFKTFFNDIPKKHDSLITQKALKIYLQGFTYINRNGEERCLSLSVLGSVLKIIPCNINEKLSNSLVQKLHNLCYENFRLMPYKDLEVAKKQKAHLNPPPPSDNQSTTTFLEVSEKQTAHLNPHPTSDNQPMMNFSEQNAHLNPPPPYANQPKIDFETLQKTLSDKTDDLDKQNFLLSEIDDLVNLLRMNVNDFKEPEDTETATDSTANSGEMLTPSGSQFLAMNNIYYDDLYELGYDLLREGDLGNASAQEILPSGMIPDWPIATNSQTSMYDQGPAPVQELKSTNTNNDLGGKKIYDHFTCEGGRTTGESIENKIKKIEAIFQPKGNIEHFTFMEIGNHIRHKDKDTTEDTYGVSTTQARAYLRAISDNKFNKKFIKKFKDDKIFQENFKKEMEKIFETILKKELKIFHNRISREIKLEGLTFIDFLKNFRNFFLKPVYNKNNTSVEKALKTYLQGFTYINSNGEERCLSLSVLGLVLEEIYFTEIKNKLGTANNEPLSDKLAQKLYYICCEKNKLCPYKNDDVRNAQQAKLNAKSYNPTVQGPVETGSNSTTGTHEGGGQHVYLQGRGSTQGGLHSSTGVPYNYPDQTYGDSSSLTLFPPPNEGLRKDKNVTNSGSKNPKRSSDNINNLKEPPPAKRRQIID